MTEPARNPARWWALVAIVLAFLPVVIDMTILHVAVPTITQSLAASNNQMLWIIDIYPLLMAGLLVPMGTLADRIGKRRMILTGLSVFGIASLFAAYAPSPEMLIAARVLLAVGGAMIVPCVLGLIRSTFEDEGERAMALGVWGMVGSAGAAVGPLVGGALLAYFWWGSVFLMNLPVIALVIPACYFLLPDDSSEGQGKWPIGQALLLIAGMLSAVYAMKAGFGGKHALPVVLAIAAFGLGLIAVFVRKQLTSDSPMLDVGLFRRPAILAGMILAVVATASLAGVELTLAQELQYVIGKTPLEAGLFMLPIMIASGIGGPLAGWLSTVLGLRRLAAIALLLGAISLIVLATRDFHNPGVQVPALLALLGLTLSIGTTASSIAIMGSVEAEKGGAAGSLEGTAYEMGGGLGISIFGVFLAATFSRNFTAPAGLSAEQTATVGRSMGDVLIVAAELPPEQGNALIAAGKAAFSSAHGVILSSAGVAFVILAVLVYMLLAKYRDGAPSAH